MFSMFYKFFFYFIIILEQNSGTKKTKITLMLIKVNDYAIIMNKQTKVFAEYKNFFKYYYFVENNCAITILIILHYMVLIYIKIKK